MSDTYGASRRALAARHDAGAAEALLDALADNIELTTGWDGGYVRRIDTTEVLAELAENGWRLARPALVSQPPKRLDVCAGCRGTPCPGICPFA